MPPRRKLVRLSPPHRGIVEGLAYEDHDPNSTIDAQNVRGHDPATGRLRLSQRPGLKNKADAATPAANKKAVGEGPIQNISTITLTETPPHSVGGECVVLKADGTPQLIDNTTEPPSLLADTAPITGEDYQFSVFDGDGNLYVVTIDQTLVDSSYAKKIRKYARPYTTGVLLSAYNETSEVKGRQVLGYALHGDVLFIWWNGAVSGDATETVTANRISDGKRVDNAGNQVETNNYFLQSGTHANGFSKANGSTGTVAAEKKNLMSQGSGVIGMLTGRAAGTGTTLHLYSVYTGQEVASQDLDTSASLHKRYDLCTDTRGSTYGVTSYDSGGNRIFRLSCLKKDGTSWYIESTNSTLATTNVGNMASVTLDDWGDETIVYVSGEAMQNSSWEKAQSASDYDPTDSDTNRLHNILAIRGDDGKIYNGATATLSVLVSQVGDVTDGGTGGETTVCVVVTSANHNLSDGDRVYISSAAEASVNDVHYVRRSDATTLELYTDKALNTPLVSSASKAADAATLRDVTQIDIIRAYNGINEYQGGYGGMSYAWNRARSNYANDLDLLGYVRVNLDGGVTISKAVIEGRVRAVEDVFPNASSELQSDQSVAAHPHAVRVGESSRETQSRGNLRFACSGGRMAFFTNRGGFCAQTVDKSSNGSILTGYVRFSESQSFFSVEYSKFVDSTVKGPYSLICDGDSYKLISFAPYSTAVSSWEATSGSMPLDGSNRARLIENWRGRVVLSGIRTDPSNWFMSAHGNPLDWDYFPSVTVETQAVAGNNSSAGRSPDIINSIVPYTDDLLLFGGDKTIWQMTGDPMSGGRLDQISGGTGMSWGRAWAIAPDGTLFFFGSRGGVYSIVPSQQGPQRLGVGTLDYELTQVDLLNNQVFMEWSTREEGLYVLVCPVSPVNSPKSYFWDSRSGAWWKDAYPEGMSPSHPVVIDGDKPDDREILIGASNGAIYSLSETAGKDDDKEISSYAFIGPITTGTDGMIAIDEMQYILPTSGNPLSYSIHTGDTVKGAVESAAFFTGNLVAGDNASDRRRVVGKNIFLKVHNKSGEEKPWSLEGVNVFAREIGAAAARTRK